MCAGKTTLGQALALASGRLFIDLDDLIARREGMSVTQLFAQRSEQAFRQAEARALEEAASCPGAIVACGGGTPCLPGAMERMNAAGLTVWLIPSADRLMSRLMDGRQQRPLLSALRTPRQLQDFVMTRATEREPHYAKAAAVFDSSLLDTEAEIALSVRDFRSRFNI